VDRYTISKLAERAGTSTDTLRYYERIGLLPEPVRSASGYRLFDDDALERVRFIKSSQRLGLSLQEASELLAIRESGICPCGRTRQLLDDRLALLEAELAELSHLQDQIRLMLEQPSAEPAAGCACGGSSFIQIRPTKNGKGTPR
jgi:DNA-binding transcriptional MerR regulator